VYAIDRIFRNRHQLDCPPSFLQGFLFSSERRIDEAERADCRTVLWLLFHRLSLLIASGGESSACLGIVMGHPRNQTFAETATKMNRILHKAIFSKSGQCSFGRASIAFAQREGDPIISYILRGIPVLRENRFDRRMQRLRVGSPFELHKGARHPGIDVLREDSESTIQGCGFFRIAAHELVAEGNLLKEIDVARIQLQSLLQIAHALLVPPLPAINIADQLGDARIIR
jgi:hypothetical protein